MEREIKVKQCKKDLWYYLHTVAAFLPEEMNESQAEKLHNLFKGVFYFGTKFDKEFQSNIEEYLRENDLTSIKTRDEAMLYLCHLHNSINVKEGKEMFLCTKENLLNRWRNDSNSPKL